MNRHVHFAKQLEQCILAGPGGGGHKQPSGVRRNAIAVRSPRSAVAVGITADLHLSSMILNAGM